VTAQERSRALTELLNEAQHVMQAIVYEMMDRREAPSWERWKPIRRKIEEIMEAS
jgi:hypothetical protein